MSEKPTTARKSWLDALRALAMLLVMLGHQLPGCDTFFLFANPVKLPLFFAITGYLFDEHRRGFRAFLKELARRLALPWAMAAAAEILLTAALKGPGPAAQALKSAFVDVTLWYLPCLFFAEIIWFLNCRLSRWWGAAAFAEFVAAGVLGRLGAPNPMMLLTACMAQPFMMLGRVYRDRGSDLPRRRWAAPALLDAWLMLGLAIRRLAPGAHIDLHLNRYAPLPWSMAMVWAGCLGLFALFSRWRQPPRIVTFIGRNTLLFYMAHNYAIAAVSGLLSRLGVRLAAPIRLVLVTALACAVCGALAVAVNRFLPELAGRRRGTPFSAKPL